MGDATIILAWAGAVIWPAALGFGLWRGLKKARGPGWIGWSVIVLVTAAWAVGIRAFLWEPETLEIRRIEVVTPRWSGAPLRIGVISDTHMGAPHMSVGRLESIIRDMNAERPDIVVLLGDFTGGSRPAPERSEGERATVMSGLPPFEKLRAPLGVWAVLGNHDWWYDGEAIEKGLQAAGVHVMENERARIERQQGGAFWIGGLADYDSMRLRPSYSDTLADREGSAIPDNEPVIVMSHWPDAFAAAPERVALTLAGHTHCGQVNLPGIGRPVAVSPGAKKWPCGLYEDRGRRLYVTGGVGVSVMPGRLGQPPEIAVVTLRSD